MFIQPPFVFAAALSFTLALAPTSLTFAQPRPAAPPSAADIAEGSRLYEEGVRLVRLNEYEKASAAFEASYKKKKNPNAIYNQAFCQGKLGHHVRAIAMFEEFVDASIRDDRDSKLRADAQQELRELKATVCRYTISGPAGTTATINGQPMPRDVGYAEPGAVVVELTSGPMKRKRESTCKAGDQQVASFDDVPAGAPSTSVVTGPEFGSPKPPVIVEPPKAQPTTSRSGGLLLAAIATGVVGTGGLVLGGVFGSQSSAAADERTTLAKAAPSVCFNQANAACTSFKNSADKATSQHTLSIVSFAAGGAMLGASVLFTILYLGSEKQVEGSKVAHALRLQIAPTLDGLIAFGQF